MQSRSCYKHKTIDLKRPYKKILAAGIKGFLDAYPNMLADGLKKLGADAVIAEISLEKIIPQCSEMTTARLSGIFSYAANLEYFADQIRKTAQSADAVLVPACAGIADSSARRVLEERVGVPIRLAATFPPQAAGALMWKKLRAEFMRKGGVIMDGDIADLHRLAEIKRQYPDIITYIDEAHAFGVRGKHGLGVIEETGTIDKFDIVIGTFGKAVASIGAFAIASAVMKDFLINKARSLIFSTALPPISCRWSKFVIEFLLGMDKEREYLLNVSEYINCKFEKYNHNIRSHSQIVPLIIGDSSKAVMLSSSLRQSGFIALPIRHPTVPAGTERIRFSLNANIRKCDIDKLIELINIYETSIYQ